MNITLTSRICIHSKPKSSSDVFSIIDSYPCVLELEIVLCSTTRKRGNKASEIKVTNESDRSKYMYSTQSILYKVLNNLEKDVVTVV